MPTSWKKEYRFTGYSETSVFFIFLIIIGKKGVYPRVFNIILLETIFVLITKPKKQI